jgi:hypothetical protein
LELDSGAGFLIMGNTFEKIKVTIDKDLEAGYQIFDKKLEQVKVTIDQDLEKFMKSIAFFQR